MRFRDTVLEAREMLTDGWIVAEKFTFALFAALAVLFAALTIYIYIYILEVALKYLLQQKIFS